MPSPIKLETWKAMPFSFTKLRLATGAVFLALCFVASFYTLARWEVPWFPILAIVVSGVGTELFYRALGLFWKHCSAEFKESIPYDTNEALQGRGTIHSYSELVRWLWLRRGNSKK